jgi:hypothetical protein
MNKPPRRIIVGRWKLEQPLVPNMTDMTANGRYQETLSLEQQDYRNIVNYSLHDWQAAIDLVQ